MFIQEMIAQLDAKELGNVWTTTAGVHALTQVKKDDRNAVSFNPGAGLLVKVFYNKASGEIKLYPAQMFEDAF